MSNLKNCPEPNFVMLVFVAGPCLLGLPVLPMNHSLPALGVFMLLMLPLFALMYASWLLCSLSGWMRPVHARFWSWELILHQFCKPWWILQVRGWTERTTFRMHATNIG
jgi:hypothetical protein